MEKLQESMITAGFQKVDGNHILAVMLPPYGAALRSEWSRALEQDCPESDTEE